MNLTALAAHICQQVGMNDTDDVAAAKLFLQRRLEMIWNGQLWRASLLEATMTLGTDGSVDLANTLWLPGRGTLLLPPEIASVLAVRQSNHALNVASLESYYRTDLDYLNMTGDPTQFQILRPCLWEFATATDVRLADDCAGAVTVAYSTDGISTAAATQNAAGTISGALVLFRATTPTLPAGLWPVLNPATSITILGAGTTQANGSYAFVTNNDQGLGIRLWVNAATGWDITSFDGLTWYLAARPSALNQYQATGSTVNVPPLTGWTPNFGDTPAPTAIYGTPTAFDLLTFSSNALPLRQRLRLTALPTANLSVRVLGKGYCPVLGDYDLVPINNAEPCLLALARGDMLLRQRQHGKARLAQEEGMALLRELANSEAFHQAGNHRIMPDSGYGDLAFCQPSHAQPFGY